MRTSDQLKITEKVWRAQVVSLAKQLGWEVYYTWTSIHSPAGFPDLVLLRDRLVFAELKTETGKLSERQEGWLAALSDCGQEVYVWRPSDFDLAAEILSRRNTTRKAAQ